MPTTYAHDLFGRAVMHHLSGQTAQVVKEYPAAYRAGLQGPDILFYYVPFRKNKVNELGNQIHEEEAFGFFENCREAAQKDPELGAYVLGVLCHFLLDSTCHPLIRIEEEKTGKAHDAIESDLDQDLMEQTGKDPFHYKPAVFLRPSRRFTGKLLAVYPGLSKRELRLSMISMRILTGILVCGTKAKRTLLLSAMKLLKADGFAGHVIPETRPECCKPWTNQLETLLKQEVPEAAEILEAYWEEESLSEAVKKRLECNFG